MYVQELKAASSRHKYKGTVKLSEIPGDEEMREILQKFMDIGVSDGWDAVIPQDAIDWLKGYVPKLSGNLRDAVSQNVNEVIRSSMQEGTTLKERMKALRESAPELERMSNARIEAIARTEITRASTMGSLLLMKSNDDVIGVEFSTTEICSSRHGLVMRLDDARLAGNTPPCHENCRSMLLALTVYDYPDGLLTSREFDNVTAGGPSDDTTPLNEIAATTQVSVQTERVEKKLSIPAVITPSKVYESLTAFYERSLELVKNYEEMAVSDKLILLSLNSLKLCKVTKKSSMPCRNT